MFAPFFEKGYFRKLADNWAQNTHTHKMITEQKQIA